LSSDYSNTNNYYNKDVVLSIDPASFCSPDEILVYVKNYGIEASDSVTVAAFRPDGTKERSATLLE